MLNCPHALCRGLLPSLLLVLATLLAGGCGYRTTELFPDQYRTIAVPIFDNNTPYKELQFDLAEALTKQIEQRTAYKVTSPATADTLIAGTITAVNQNLVNRVRVGAVPEELELMVTIDFEWKDLRTAQTIMDRRSLSVTGPYVPARGVGEPIQRGRHVAVERLAREIVSQLRGAW
jgi:outer membrane lipopolysaccharide assembly protein LptE/RlpB